MTTVAAVSQGDRSSHLWIAGAVSNSFSVFPLVLVTILIVIAPTRRFNKAVNLVSVLVLVARHS